MTAADDEAQAPVCLRCPEVRLRHLDGFSEKISFFECPSCHHQYARETSGELAYRWLQPISLPLYCILFSDATEADARRIADLLMRQSSSAERMMVMAQEIESELERPTQQVRDILDNPQPEDTCREFLANVAKRLREGLAET